MTTGEGKSRLPLLSAAFVVARRDFQAILFSKAFFFFLLGPLFMIAVMAGASMLGAKAASSSTPAVLAVAMDRADAAALAAARERLAPMLDLPRIEVVDDSARIEPARLLDAADRNFGAVVSGTLAAPRLTGTEERIARWQGPVALLAAEAHGTGAAAYPTVTLETTASSTATKRSARAGTATAGLTLLFLLTMLLAGMVLSNLVEEKANKIIEILAAAIPMDAVFLGKLFAMLGVSFVGITVWGGVAALAFGLSGNPLADLPSPAVGWPLFVALFLAYFALAYLLLGSIFLAIGAMAPTVRDVQTLSMPATILQLGVFFLATFAMNAPGSPAELFAVIFPVSSPYAMVARAAQMPQVWPHLLALGWQVVWVAVFVRAGSSLFKRRVMKSGPRPPGRSRWGRRAAKV